jgi:hypothetical protein
VLYQIVITTSVFNKSIKVIWNPLIISDKTHTRHNWCQKWDGLIELLDLRLNCIVTATFYEYGDATNVSTPAGRNESQSGENEG